MHTGRKEECDECCGVLVDLHGGDGGVIDVAQEEVMHRSVPVAGELIPGDGVPPIGVESSVCEVGDFGEEVEDAFPDHVPCLVPLAR